MAWLACRPWFFVQPGYWRPARSSRPNLRRHTSHVTSSASTHAEEGLVNGDAGETLDPDVAAEEARVRHHPYNNHAFNSILKSANSLQTKSIRSVNDSCMLSSGKSCKVPVCKRQKKALYTRIVQTLSEQPGCSVDCRPTHSCICSCRYMAFMNSFECRCKSCCSIVQERMLWPSSHLVAGMLLRCWACRRCIAPAKQGMALPTHTDHTPDVQ